MSAFSVVPHVEENPLLAALMHADSTVLSSGEAGLKRILDSVIADADLLDHHQLQALADALQSYATAVKG